MNFDLIVLGSGPGGYVAAIRAAQTGLSVAVVEKAELGGVCLNWGCIPTKALLKSAQVFNYIKHADTYGIAINGDISPDFKAVIDRSRLVASNMSKGIEFLFKKNKISIVRGFGKLISKNQLSVIDADNNETIVSAKHIILATGARSKELPGVKQDGKRIIGYREALTLENLPKSMAVIGSGAIGTELAFFYASMGTEVTIIEFLPNIVPLEDEEVSKQLARSLKKAGIKIMTDTRVQNVDVYGDDCIVSYLNKKGESSITTEIVLSAVGVIPNLENIGLEELNIELEKGKIKVDEYYKTNIDGIYAIGDIINSPALAHVASAEAITCIEHIVGMNPPTIDYSNIPSCVYCVPEIASVGITEQEAKEKEIPYKIGKFPFIASGKAAASGSKDGFIKLIFDENSDELLGAHFIGDNVTEMIAEMVVLKKLNGKAKDLIKTIHPHPSLSEAIMEAAADAHNEAVHL
ncbi:MAG: dihydrolipoyl dehydrogenase [Bacteroidales bacterium]|nr:dihydrolipoyl dehydrogenase [Bacteroidales bacterium]MDD4216262.1 dihydrolipoyl dehydrogenase [Bacteroidales bacterium]MDY0142943.1 dihydrolipoyl dehydrogenase [Bacteroidales bacterium]